MFSKLFNKAKKVDEALLLPQKRFSFMPEEEQLEFQDYVTKYFEENHSDYIVDFNEGQVLKPNKGGIFYLDNIAQYYHQASSEERQAIVRDHFDKIINAEKEIDEYLKSKDDFNKIKKYLAIRLYGTNYNEEFYEKSTFREDIVGTKTILVFDLPSQIINVTPQEFKKWGLEKDEVFKTALDNTLRNTKFKPRKSDLGNNRKGWTIENESIYTATSALYLEAFPQCIGTYGSIILIPHRHIVIIYPIENIEVLEIINLFPVVATRMYEAGPGSITSNMYWYYNDKFTNIPYNLDEKKLGVYTPTELVHLLNKLAEDSKKK